MICPEEFPIIEITPENFKRLLEDTERRMLEYGFLKDEIHYFLLETDEICKQNHQETKLEFLVNYWSLLNYKMHQISVQN